MISCQDSADWSGSVWSLRAPPEDSHQLTSRTQGLDSWSYTYDDLLRLTQVTYTGSGPNGRSNIYDYDTTDNLTRITSTPGAISNFTPNADNQVSTVTGSGTSTTWLYDLDGNLTDDGTNLYTWDAEQRLIRIKRKGDGQTSNLGYDGLGRRTSITETKQGDTAPNKTTRYVYCGAPTPCAANGTAGLTIIEPQGEYNASATPTQQYYARDHLGSVMQMVDNQGNTLGTRQYTAYGQTMQASGNAPQLGYAGMLYHAPSGLYLTPNRGYNPTNGRWLSRDPIGEVGGRNLYAYVGGNPTSRIDPLGLDWIYVQSTGQMFHQPSDALGGGPPAPVGTAGYAGHGIGVNNSALDIVPSVGPLPTGTYQIEPQRTNVTGTGLNLPGSMRLAPNPSNWMHGREGFLIHGDNSRTNRSASEGCIVEPRAVRDIIGQSPDRILRVIP